MRPLYGRANRTRPATLIAVGVWLVAAASAAQAGVIVNVFRVGYPSSGGPVIRTGAWIPVIVDVSLDKQAGFDGTLRLAQYDNDGDRCYDSVEVHVHADTGGSLRRVLYVPANPVGGRIAVELLDTEGSVVEVIANGELTRAARPPSEAPPRSISAGTFYILSMSEDPIGRIERLDDVDAALFSRELVVGHIAPTDLPELWIGLEMVDCIVWDDARPSVLTPAQLSALVEWVHQGGMLLIAASRSAGEIAQTDALDGILPVTIGEVFSTGSLRTLRREMLDDDTAFVRPIPVARCVLRDGATQVLHEYAEDVDSEIISRRVVGGGHVIFCAATLKDVFGEKGDPITFFRKALLLKMQSPADEAIALNEQSLFRYVVGAVSFSTKGGLYLVIAVVFSLVYVFTATVGSWGMLRGRGWLRHSWGVFSLVAIAASVLSVVAVAAIKGVGYTLHQISIVDVDAGDTFARGTVFFGLKTGTDSVVDVWLPSNHLSEREPTATRCFLRPLPTSNDMNERGQAYADPGKYRLIPASAVIEGVRVRGTLKRFEGRWEGPLPGGGKLTGHVKVRRDGGPAENWQITADSYIINDLGVDLKSCYLIQPVFDLHIVPPEWGRPSVYQRDDHRDDYIFALPIGDLPSTGLKVKLTPACYQPKGTQTRLDYMRQHTLRTEQRVWSRSFPGLSGYRFGTDSDPVYELGQEKDALLLMSTVGDFNPVANVTTMQTMFGPRTWSRDRLRQLDLREKLERDCVYVLGWADEPGPARLAVRTGSRGYRVLAPESDHALTMYRIRIPIVNIEEVRGDTRPPVNEEDEKDPYEP